MADLKLSLAMNPYDRLLPLLTGEVKPDGITLDYMGWPTGQAGIAQVFYDQTKFHRYDISEMSMCCFLRLRPIGWPYRALPVFHNRNFAYAAIAIRKSSGIRQGHPEDLKGKRVGTNDYVSSVGLWVLGVLGMKSDIKPEDMVWYQQRAKHFSMTDALAEAGLAVPEAVERHYAKRDINTMLHKGELDACISYDYGMRQGGTSAAADTERSRASTKESSDDIVTLFADPLGPDNILHVGVGPLTGIMGTKTILSFISPLTGWAGRSATSGYIGDEIMRAHYNAGILLKGKAKRPSYLYVHNDKVEVRDASDLWGKWKQETEATLRDRLNKETGEVFAVLCIGPAGENLVRYANATTEFVHSASKWGCGAVMGSKNLKAIAVKGTEGPLYADHQKVWQLFKTYATSPKTALHKLGESRWGHTTSPASLLRHADEGIKNSHLSYHEIAEQSSYLEHQLKYHAWTDGCPGCAAACFVPYFRNSQRGAFGGEFRHDNVGGFNANIMVGFEEMTEITSLENELGMDGEELGGIVAWAMYLYEHGIITKEDLGGIDLQWGDVEATCALMKKIAYKEGRVPAALAEGFRRAYQVFGEESKWFAFEVHGCAAPTYDIRNKQGGMGLTAGTSHNGARVGFGLGSELSEAATICNFASGPFVQIWGSIEEAARVFLNAVCGWNLTVDDIKEITLRNYYFNRCVSLREGYHPSKDDYLPPRAFDEPITDKYGTTWVWDRAEFEEEKKSYYVKTLKLTEAGLPPRGELERLGLDFVISTLEPMRARLV